MLVQTKDIQTQGDLGGEKIAMSLDQNSLVHLMSILSDLYSDPGAAIVREYTTNALDSHIAAYQTKPVEVFTPTYLSPYFIVTDYGVGLSRTDLIDIYSKYGASTKRNNNNEAGMLGLGCKSALTFTEQFNVTAIKDGRKCLVSISRAADGSGGLEIVDESDTDLPNGVTIKIPVSATTYGFIDKVKEFAKWVKPGSLLVDDKDLSFDESSFIKLDTDLFIKAEGGYYDAPDDILIMGNVSYPVNHRVIGGRVRLIARVPMGSVDFAPSREALMYTTRTNATIAQYESKVRKLFDAHFTEQIQNAASFREAWLAKIEAEDLYGFTLNVQYNGEDLPSKHYYIKAKSANWYKSYLYQEGRAVNCNDTSITHRSMKDAKVITNYASERFNKLSAKKVDKYFEDEYGEDVNYVYLVKPDADLRLIDASQIHDWDDIKVIKIPNTPGAPRRKKTDPILWKGFEANSGKETHFVPDDTKDIYYKPRKTYGRSGYSTPISVAKAGNQFLFVRESETDKFLKLYPNAKLIDKFFEEKVTEYLAKLTPEDLVFLQKDYSRYNCHLDLVDVLDPELKEVVSVVTKVDKRHIEYQLISDYWYKTDYVFRSANHMPKYAITKHTDLIQKYPLIELQRYYSNTTSLAERSRHLTLYCNYIYTESLKEEES